MIIHNMVASPTIRIKRIFSGGRRATFSGQVAGFDLVFLKTRKLEAASFQPKRDLFKNTIQIFSVSQRDVLYRDIRASALSKQGRQK